MTVTVGIAVEFINAISQRHGGGGLGDTEEITEGSKLWCRGRQGSRKEGQKSM